MQNEIWTPTKELKGFDLDSSQGFGCICGIHTDPHLEVMIFNCFARGTSTD